MRPTRNAVIGAVCLSIANTVVARAEADGPDPARAVTESAPATAAPAVPQQVSVQGVKPDPSETRISVTEARLIPGGFGDPVRAVAALPGVSPMGRGAPYLYVRGAPPANTAYVVDGVRVPLLFHAGVASSVVQSALIDAIDFFPSAVPARYGGFTGGILVAETRPPADRLHGEATAKAFESSVLVEAPFADDRGSALVAVRYGYPELVLSIVSPTQHIDYWDYQTRASWKVGDRDRIGVFALGSHDRLGHLAVEDLASDFHRVDLRYDHDFSDAAHVRVAMTAGWSSQGAAPIYVDDWTLGARVEGDARVSRSVLVRGGAELHRDAYGMSASAAALDAGHLPIGANPPPTNVVTGVYGDVLWTPHRRFSLTFGARFDVFESERALASASGTVPTVEPRIASRVTFGRGVAWLSSIGVAHQLPQLRAGTAPATVVSLPGFSAGDVHLQTSAQASEGIEAHLPGQVLLTTTAFFSATSHMTDLPSSCYGELTGSREAPGPTVYHCADKPVDGVAYGVELAARRALTKRLSGWLSYTMSRSTEAYMQSGGPRTILSGFDRTHVLSVIAGYDLGAHWRAGTRLLVYSGTPSWQTAGDQRVAVPYDGYRFPPYFRADVRLEKRWLLGDERSMAFVAEVQNVTASHEIDRLDCGPPVAAPGTCVASSNAPVTIPSVGVELSF